MSHLKWEKKPERLKPSEWELVHLRSTAAPTSRPIWDARLRVHRNREDMPIWVELRRMIKYGNVLIIVSDGEGFTQGRKDMVHTQGVNVQITSNNPIQLTFEELDELREAVREAKEAIETVKAIDRGEYKSE